MTELCEKNLKRRTVYVEWCHVGQAHLTEQHKHCIVFCGVTLCRLVSVH